MNNKKLYWTSTLSETTLKKAYLDDNLSKAEICEKFNITNWSLDNLLKKYNIKKTKELIVQRRKNTNLIKYGVDNASKSDTVKNKISEKNKANVQSRMEKTATTKAARYGNPRYNNMDKNRLTKAVKYNNQNYNNRSKYKETMLEKWGADNGFKLIKTKSENLQRVFDDHEYSPIFKELFKDREKAIKFLSDNKYSYFDLAKIFNAPYYTIQMWVTRNDLKDYISYTFEGKSHYEDEIVAFIKSLKINNIERNIKNILDKQEIDIYLPDYNIGIEFNGTFWHSDLYKDRDYHFNKSKLAEEKGIRLIHIYEYEWKDESTREKIKSLLRIALGKVPTRIYARDCEIREIRDKEAAILNNSNHLQNHRKAHITYGLFYKDKLVQLMSFSKNRKYEWEIIRGCPASNNLVIGGVSKLFKHFIKENNPKEIFSYCDFNKFDGHGYEQLGMKFIGYTGPDMKYIIKGQVINRQPSKYKQIKGQIEARIYGSGSKKYLWKAESTC